MKARPASGVSANVMNRQDSKADSMFQIIKVRRDGTMPRENSLPKVKEELPPASVEKEPVVE